MHMKREFNSWLRSALRQIEETKNAHPHHQVLLRDALTEGIETVEFGIAIRLLEDSCEVFCECHHYGDPTRCSVLLGKVA